MKTNWLLLHITNHIQCLRSSRSQNGGADLRSHCSEKIQTTLIKWMGRPQLLPEMFEIVLRPIWCDAGSEQPSPPLHRAAAARLLTGDRHRCSCSVNAAVFVWLTNSHISQFCKIIFLHPLDLHCTALYTNA